MGVEAVAKKRDPASEAKPAGKARARGGPETWKSKPLIVNLRGSDAFKAWLRQLAAADRRPVSGVIERALVHYAKTIGFGEEAPER